jgi:hypothetical protein
MQSAAICEKKERPRSFRRKRVSKQANEQASKRASKQAVKRISYIGNPLTSKGQAISKLLETAQQKIESRKSPSNPRHSSSTGSSSSSDHTATQTPLGRTPHTAQLPEPILITSRMARMPTRRTRRAQPRQRPTAASTLRRMSTTATLLPRSSSSSSKSRSRRNRRNRPRTLPLPTNHTTPQGFFLRASTPPTKGPPCSTAEIRRRNNSLAAGSTAEMDVAAPQEILVDGGVGGVG